VNSDLKFFPPSTQANEKCMKEITQINCPPATADYFREPKSRELQKEYPRENSRTLKIKIDSRDDSMTYF